MDARVTGLAFPTRIGSMRYRLGPVPHAPLSLPDRALEELFNPPPEPLRWGLYGGVIVPKSRWSAGSGLTKLLWLTLPVASDAAPGQYAGQLEFANDSGRLGQIPIELEVLPFALECPAHVAVCATYFVPVTYAFFDEQRFWDRVRLEFRDMRDHGLTCVQLTGMGIENHAGLERLFALYREAGFEHPIYWLESYTAIEWIEKRYGLERGTEAFYAKFLQLHRELLLQARQRDWPELIFNFGDEFTNTATEEFGAELARRLRRLPGIVIAADANGYRELSLLAPHVDVLAFNHGWDGPAGVNRGRRQLPNAETVAQVRAAGAEPWLVNLDRGRLSHGVYLWKMSRLGVRGRIQWIYSDYTADPHNPFDGRARRSGPMVLPGADASLPTVGYEQMRAGLVDLAYLHTLETRAAAASPGPARDAARALLERIDASISDDYSVYRGPDAERWTEARYAELRDEIIEAILALRAP